MTIKTRRGFLKLLGSAPLAVTLAEHGLLTPAHADGDLVWSSTGGSWGNKLNQVFVETPGFSEQTGKRATLAVEMDSVAASKVVSNCGSAPFDVSSAGEPELALTRDCIEDYDESIVTNLPDIYGGARYGKHYAAFCILSFGMVWNRERVEEPEDWSMLLESRFKGRTAIPGYGWYGMPWLHAMNKHLGGDEDNIDPGIEFAARLVRDNDAIIIENADQGTQVFQRDEVDIMPFWNGRAVRMQQEGLPIEFKMIKNGIAVGVGFTVNKGTENREAANVFINNTLEPELQTKFSEWSTYPPTNRRAKIPKGLEAYELSDEMFELTADLDWGKINEHRSEYLSRWNREVLGA